MHDIRAIRLDPERFDRGWERKGLGPQSSHILAADERWRALTAEKQSLEAARNRASKDIGKAKATGDTASFDRLRSEVDAAKVRLAQIDSEESEALAARDALLAGLPNLPAPDVPAGASETDNVEVRRWSGAADHGPPRVAHAADHVTLGEGLGLMDFEAAARMSGARFVVLKGGLARLERALAAFMLDTHTLRNGYTEIVPPFLVRERAMYGTGQLPKFGEDLFRTTADHFLIPTAEVSLTNLVMDQILERPDTPIRLTAHTPCFRAEAGSAGRDVRGMIRQHQFSKVELVSVCAEDQSQDEHERMTECAAGILKALDLPFRTMLLCAGDMGFGAQKTYDLEVWLPSQGRYREISSCSNCGDFQARRMNARYRAADKDVRYLHTLNGSGLAVGRTLVAVLETYQNADGSVSVPAVLVPYMAGVTRLERQA